MGRKESNQTNKQTIKQTNILEGINVYILYERVPIERYKLAYATIEDSAQPAQMSGTAPAFLEMGVRMYKGMGFLC